MRHRTVRAIQAVAWASSVLLLAACTQSVALAVYEGEPPAPLAQGVDDQGVVQEGPVAWWLSDDSFAIAFASGSCVPVASDVEAAGPDLVSVTFTREFALGCSTSSVWHTYELSLPHDLSPSTTTEVVVEGLSGEPTSVVIADIGDS